MLILTITHIKSRIEHAKNKIMFELPTHIVYLKFIPHKTLDSLFYKPFLYTISRQPLCCWFIITYIFNLHDYYEKDYVYDNDQFFVP